MKKILFGILATLVILPSQGQEMKKSGTSADNIVPNGWDYIFEKGDLNKDGIADMAIIATPLNEDNIKVRDDGYVYNFNQPILAIYWGKKDGSFSLFKQYNNVIPARPSEFISIDPTLSINDRQALSISLSYFASAGGWDSTTTTHRFRFQNGDFFLIGEDESVITRNTGALTETSKNYLSHKQSVSTSNISSKKKPVVKWTNLPKTPLRPLADGFELE